jgi:hypothetical protein
MITSRKSSITRAATELTRRIAIPVLLETRLVTRRPVARVNLNAVTVCYPEISKSGNERLQLADSVEKLEITATTNFVLI